MTLTTDRPAGFGDPWTLINTPVGDPWSGRTRYAAAMYFYHAGEMDDATLEIYRICSRIDHENPLDVLRSWRIGRDWLARFTPPSR